MLENISALNENELETVNGGTSGYSGACFVYVIKSGDCLSKIAAKYGTTVSILCQINNISNPDKIYAGNKLLIPYKG